MKRITVILILFTLLLSGCISVEEPVNYIPKNYNELVPIEIEEAVNAIWAKEYSHLGSHRYYGAYGDCVVWFTKGQLPTIETKEIAGEEFYCNYIFSINVYRNGKILSLEDAYKQRWLSKDQIKLLADFHVKSLDHPMGVRVYTPESYGDEVPEYLQQNIADAWEKYKGEPMKSGPIYYGKYAWRTVILVPIEEGSGVTTQTIGGYEFQFNGDFEMMVYLGRVITSLAKAVENGTINQEHLALIYQFHREHNAALYENADVN